jgi:hypothetical protein
MKVGIKYCGGCNPEYDRVEVVGRIKNELGGILEIVPHDVPELEIILVVQGCKTACADLSGLKCNNLKIIRDIKEAEQFISDFKNFSPDK